MGCKEDQNYMEFDEIFEHLDSGKTLTISEINDFDGNVSKVILSEAVRTCKETFTLSDFHDLEYLVSRTALLDVAKRQGDILNIMKVFT